MINIFNNMQYMFFMSILIIKSRGAELIQELAQKRIQEQHESERKVLEKIKSKMDRIKATQKKIQGFGAKDPESHEKGTLYKHANNLTLLNFLIKL